MDLNREYADHQMALIAATAADCASDRASQLDIAADIAARITAFQARLGAAAACAWSVAHTMKAGA